MFAADEGHVGESLGARCVIRVPSAATGGAMGAVELAVPAGGATPMHRHRREEETLHVLEGRFRFWCGDRSWTGGEGATVVLPRGIPHAFRNIGGAPGRLLEIITPGGFEGFFEQCGTRGLRAPKDAAALQKLGAEFGLEITGPPPAAEEEDGAGGGRF
jgi:quercetin dioxygenase-like cupin family protein